MNRIPVVSSNIASIGYEAATLTLEVEFKSGAVYHYFDVPEMVHAEFMRADSKGQFLNASIREHYRYAKL